MLIDTHLLIWYAMGSPRLSCLAREMLDDPANDLFFSVASLWEIAIKKALGRDDFRVEARALRHGLLENAFVEMAITADHAFAVEALASIHKDPFDRMLIAQTITEGAILLTVDQTVARYPGPIRLV